MWIFIVMYLFLIPCTALFLRIKHVGGDDTAKAMSVKAACTLSIIIPALVSTAGAAGGTAKIGGFCGILITAGLIFGLTGDIVICRREGGGFICGMLYFAVGHLCYIGAFFSRSRHLFLGMAVFAAVILLLLVFAWRRKLHLGKMLVPVAAYCGIITGMLSLALTLPFSAERGWISAVGAILFAVSDAIVGYGAYGCPKSRALDTFGLYCYFIGQSLFAVSIHYMR